MRINININYHIRFRDDDRFHSCERWNSESHHSLVFLVVRRQVLVLDVVSGFVNMDVERATRLNPYMEWFEF